MLAGDRSARPRLLALTIGARPDAWRAVGFAPDDAGAFRAGDVIVQLAPDAPAGIAGWALSEPVAGLPVSPATVDPGMVPSDHPNGVTGIDHVVIATTDLDEATGALVAAGCEVRGERAGSVGGRDIVQRFLPLQNALVELVSDTKPGTPGGPGASFWGVTFICPGLDLGIPALGPQVSAPRPAVQPGRFIATAGRAADLGTRVAFMTPRSL